jgi:uncharacterized protein YraI
MPENLGLERLEMIMRTLLAACAALSIAAVSIATSAAPAAAEDIALAKNSMRLFGGPSMAYPRIGLITWGQGLKVVGCESASGWCEVVADGQSGWVPAGAMRWPDPTKAPLMKKDRESYHVVL